MPVREVNRALGLELPTDGPNTLNGLILEQLQDIPEADVSIKIGGVPMEIVNAQGRAVKTVRIFRPRRGSRSKTRPAGPLNVIFQSIGQVLDSALESSLTPTFGQGARYGNGSSGGKRRTQGIHLPLGRQGQGRQDRPRRDARGERELVNATLRRQGIVVHKVKKQKLGGGGVGQRQGHRAVHAPAGDHDEGRRAAAAVLRHRRQGRVQPGGRQAADGHQDRRRDRLLARAAFRKYPLHFDALFCNLVAAGEQAGILETLLDRLATYKEKMLAIKSKIKSALFYPIAIIVVAFVITAVIMIFVIPAFKQVFTSFGADLPAPTLIVMAISDFFVAILVHHLPRDHRRRLGLPRGVEALAARCRSSWTADAQDCRCSATW